MLRQFRYNYIVPFVKMRYLTAAQISSSARQPDMRKKHNNIVQRNVIMQNDIKKINEWVAEQKLAQASAQKSYYTQDKYQTDAGFFYYMAGIFTTPVLYCLFFN